MAKRPNVRPVKAGWKNIFRPWTLHGAIVPVLVGGAIAFGHPNGASGGRLCIFTMKQLIRTGGKYGLFGACCGGGLGVSTLIENIYEE